MTMNARIKKLFSTLLCVSMLVQNAPAMAFAAAEDNLCDHHPEHTAECGYAAEEGEPCAYNCEICLDHGSEEEEEQETTAPSEPETTEAAESTEETEAPEITEAEEPIELHQTVTGTIELDVGDFDNDEAFAAYVERLFYGDSGASSFAPLAGDRLTGANKALYDRLKVEIAAIAAGTRTSTVVDFDPIAAGIPAVWTEEELGVDMKTADGEIVITEAVQDEMLNRFFAQLEINLVLEALFSDCPYDMYWFNKEQQTLFFCNVGAGYENDKLCGYIPNVTVVMHVSKDYRGENDTTVDSDKPSTAAKAAETAKEIAAANAGKTDYEKLVAFKNYICDAVSYNVESVTPGYERGYGDPWQMIYAFDGDPTTNIVCEGYSKAFQYLCDLSGLDCISVGGVFGDAQENENHMWNIVTLNGQNYLVDVTNTDEGTVGQDGELFLAGNPSGSWETNYPYALDDQLLLYVYTDVTLSVWGADKLELAKEDYIIRDVPAAGEGYALDYLREYITVAAGYEVADAQNDGVVSGSLETYLGKILKVRRAETADRKASGWTCFTVADRPAAPEVSVKNETLKGQKDGAVSGLTAAMEYSTDNGANWTVMSENASRIAGLAGNTAVLVRVKATETAPHGEVQTCTVAEGTGITVSYVSGAQEADGMPGVLTGLSYGTKLTKPADPIAKNTDFVFRGWYKDSACTNAWNFAEDTLTTETVTLYAKWERIYCSVTAEIKDHKGDEYQGDVQVRLMRGDAQIYSVTGTSGNLTFSRVKAGMYNLVAVYTDASGEHTKTELITVDQDKIYTLTLPRPGVNSHLNVGSNSQTPAVMVDKLDQEAEHIQEQAGSDAKVAVEMTVTGKTESQVSDTVVTAVETATDKATVEYLDITVTRQINDGAKAEMSETTNVLEILVPYSPDRKADLRVFRHHNGQLQEFENNHSREDRSFYYAEGYVHIFTNRFSDYMISYKVCYNVTFDANGGTVTPGSKNTEADGTLQKLPEPVRSGYVFSGWYTAKTGGTKVTTDTVFTADATIYARWSGYTVTVAPASNGTVSVDHSKAPAGTKVTIKVTPNSGYRLSTLKVKDTAGNYYALGAVNDDAYSFTMPAADVTVTATFVRNSTAAADNTNPKTGDDFQLVLLSSVATVSLLTLAALLLSRKKYCKK